MAVSYTNALMAAKVKEAGQEMVDLPFEVIKGNEMIQDRVRSSNTRRVTSRGNGL